MNRVAIVGTGGREYEMGRVMEMSEEVDKIYYLGGGNAGTEDFSKALHVQHIPKYEDTLFLIGPEAPLVDGMADRLRERGALVVGPSAEAAQLEASKAFATRFMRRNRIPHPVTEIFSDFDEAKKRIAKRDPSEYVIKADGLAGGKGVLLPKTHEEALRNLKALMKDGMFDGAGETVVIQERLHGPEVSVFALCDGEDFVMLGVAQDHKRLKNKDKGPNTGGMGAYTHVPEAILSPNQYSKIRTIIQQTLLGMYNEETPYQGILFTGIMLAEECDGDPIVIEYNVRSGDPETQVVFPGFEDQAYPLFRAAAEGKLTNFRDVPRTVGQSVLTVCLAAENYPDKPVTGEVIFGLRQEYEGVTIHHGGTAKTHDGRRVSTAGGRVLYITARGETVDQAAERAYGAIGHQNGGIWFNNMQYRTDIGNQARSS